MASQVVSVHGRDNVVVQIMGDSNHVYVGLAHLKLIPVERRIRKQPLRDIDILDPAYQAVQLVGRESDMQFVRDWLVAEPGIAVTSVIGPGGSGKTRLALEVLQGLPENWQGGFLTAEETERFLGQENLSRWSWQKPTLIVVDYAALLGEALARWFSELADHPAPEHRLRILLLERHAEKDSGWYGGLTDATWHGREVRKLFWPDQPRRVAPLDELSQRWQVLESGLHASAALAKPGKAVPQVPKPGIDAWFDQRLKEPQWADPLLLLMAAVIAVSDGQHAALQLSRPDLAKTLAERERDRVRSGGETRAAGNLLCHLYACVTLCGGLETKQASNVAEQEFKALHKEYPGGPGQAVEDLARIVGVKEHFPPLQPDLLGEALLQVTFGERGKEATSRLAAVAARGVASSLIRSARDFGTAGEQWPLEWLQTLIAAGMSDTSILMEIADALPKQTLILRKLAVEVERSLVDRLREQVRQTGRNQRILALSLNNLSSRQGAMGHHEAALASIEEAVRIYKGLATSNPDTFLPDLARSLNNLSNSQSNMGQRSRSLTSIEEAVGIRRELARSNRDVFLPDLAESLNNLSNSQRDMGQHAAALASSDEGVRIRRELAKSNPEAFLPDLAESLNNLSNSQDDMGQREAALASIGEAVRIRRELAESNPDGFLPDLARSLSNLSVRLGDLGQQETALTSIEEAVRIFRGLARSNPDAFLPDLATSLNILSNGQQAMGQVALASIEEAVRIQRRLAESNPDTFVPDLAMALNSLSNRQGEMGQHDAALASIEEAVRLYTSLVKSNPDPFLASLAGSLNNLFTHQSAMGLRAAAFASIEEAVKLYRKLAASRPGALLPDLATSLNNLAVFQGAMGQHAAALASVEEAVLLYRGLARSHPDVFLPGLAKSLSILGDCLDAENRLSEACLAAEEALRTLAPFFSRQPAVFKGIAWTTLLDYLGRRQRLGREPESQILEPYRDLLDEMEEIP